MIIFSTIIFACLFFTLGCVLTIWVKVDGDDSCIKAVFVVFFLVMIPLLVLQNWIIEIPVKNIKRAAVERGYATNIKIPSHATTIEFQWQVMRPLLNFNGRSKNDTPTPMQAMP